MENAILCDLTEFIEREQTISDGNARDDSASLESLKKFMSNLTYIRLIDLSWFWIAGIDRLIASDLRNTVRHQQCDDLPN